MQPHIGEIRIFAGNFPPNGWEFCSGQLLPISENEALFQLIGTTYGGDGQETFALPDLRGRVPIHMGDGPSGIYYQLGEMGGVETVTLTVQQIPIHNHPLTGPLMPAYGANPGTTGTATGNFPSISPGTKLYSTIRQDEKFMAAPDSSPNQVLSPTGGSQPHDNMQPYLCVNYIISLFGVWPSQT